MPKKVGTYIAVDRLSLDSENRDVLPGETVELPLEVAKILLANGAIMEVKDGSDNKLVELVELQDRAE